MAKSLKYFLLAIILMFVQIMILDKLYLLKLPNVYIYILIILLLPYKFNRILLLFLSFGLGLTLDMFNSTPGLHAIAATFVAFIRTPLLNSISNFEEYDNNVMLSHHKYKWTWFFKYYGIIIITHNTIILLLQYLTFINFYEILIRILISSTITFGFIFITYMFFVKR